MAWKVGQVVGNEYTIERELPEGGFGITYLALKKNGQKVVLKTLNDKVQQRPDFAKLQEDFLNEALRLAKCPHPHIAKVGQIFQEGPLWCMVMDYIDGGNLADRVVQKGILPEDEALIYIQQIGAALTVVHQQGLLHRDIKPQNIMLRKGTKEAVLIDFGIAREFTPNLTQTHTEFLTHGYAPIEQYYKRNKRGAYTDIYALAATLYSLLTGVVPVSALDRESGAPLEPPKRLNPKIRDQINQAILKGMALKPHKRPQSMDDWLKMLGIATVPVSPQSRIATVPISPKLKPAPIFLFGMGMLMALCIAAIVRPPNISVVISTQPSYPVSVDSLMVIQPQFDYASSFSEGLAQVKINDKWGSIDKTGKMIIPPQFDMFFYFSEGLAEVYINKKDGYIDKTGKMIISPQFYLADSFSEGLAAVYINDKWGYIDKTGKMIISPQFDNRSHFSEGLAGVTINKKDGYIDKTGKMIIPPQFDSAYDFSEGLALVKINNKYSYIDKTGKMIIQPQEFHQFIIDFSEGLAALDINKKYGYIDKTGKMIIPPQFDSADYFSEGLARVEINKKYGYIDKTGKMIISPQFYNVTKFSDGLARVIFKDKCGFIDKTGKMIIPLQFDEASDFNKGLAQVKINNKWGYIDKTGKIIITPQFDYADSFSEGLARVKINGKWGYIRNPLVK
jgi:serine/threonine protein kinase